MATLKIENLVHSSRLDRRALADIYGGGMSFGWLRPYTEQRSASTPFGLYIGQINVYNQTNLYKLTNVYNLIDPVFNTVNQVEYTNIAISNVTDSSISSQIGQGQNGLAG